MQSSYALEIFLSRLLGALSFGDVLSDANESHRCSGVVPDREAASVNPSNRTVRPDDSVFAVKPLRSCPVGLVDASPVIGMNQLEPEFGIILKTFAAPAAYFFESRAYIVDQGAVGSRDEKYFPDVFRQLAESLFALAQLSFDKLAFDAKGNTIGHGGHCIQGV